MTEREMSQEEVDAYYAAEYAQTHDGDEEHDEYMDDAAAEERQMNNIRAGRWHSLNSSQAIRLERNRRHY
jgi:hypothetical protein